jgi:hypothetical protein
VRTNVHDSNGPNIRVRGNAYQVMEKYLAMARDAASAGDRIAAENYYQHAEHYFRTLNASGGNGTGERHNHHHMNTPSDPMGDDGDGDGDDDMPGNRPNSYEQRPNAAPHAAARPIEQPRIEQPRIEQPRIEQPRIDPAQAEQPRTDMPIAPSPAGATQPHEARGQGDNEPRRRGPNGRRRPPMHDGQGQRHGGNPQGAPARDPRSISPASPAEAASTESDPIDTEKPSDA